MTNTAPSSQLTVIAPSIVPAASSATSQVCAALATAQGRFTNPKRTKTATVRPRDGGAGYTFAYAPLEEVVDAVKSGLAENGLSRQQYLFRDDSGTYWLRTVLWHASGEWISGDYPVIYAKDTAQGFAGGVTYAKRQGLSLLLGLAAEDDEDGNTADANMVDIKPTQQARATRKPKPPAENVMQGSPSVASFDPDTGEVDPAAEHDARLMAAAHGRAGLPAEKKLREEWAKTPKDIQAKLQPNTVNYLKIAHDIDQAHSMAGMRE